MAVLATVSLGHVPQGQASARVGGGQWEGGLPGPASSPLPRGPFLGETVFSPSMALVSPGFLS